MERRKIAFIIHSLQAGGMERVMSELINNFAKKKEYEIHLILYGIKRDIFYSISDEVICHKPMFDFDNRFRTWCTIKTLFFLRKKLMEINPISILSFGEKWNNLVLISSLGSSLPVYVSDRSQPDKPLGFIDEYLRKWLYPKAKGVIVQTERALQSYSQIYHHHNFKIIGNPIRDMDIDQQNKKNEILMVSRLIKSKQQDQLIKIFAQLNAPDWKLILVGYDHLKQENQKEWEALAEDLDIASRVVFVGKCDDVETYYARAKIFAFTSRSEGFPNVIGEAMASGLPVVSYDCIAGPSELIINEENGYLIPLNNQSEFKDKLQKLIDNPDLRKRIGDSAKNHIKRFELNNICNEFESFIVQKNKF